MNKLIIMLLLICPITLAQASTCSVTFSRFSLGFNSIIPIGTTIKSSNNGDRIEFMVIPDPTNEYFDSSKNAYLVPGTLKDIDVRVTRSPRSASGTVPVGYINLISSSLPGIDTVINKVDLSGC